ncbi:ubiquitin carboxyl-terminal hydrolase MINDY-1 [Lagopus leucura]|uniref:ubiquitin carboxyl-terminal hydrolase MINDY-1 n=1 Tax=Lagopus leucura TaxID=30410 RepID=UPI001C6683A3|nr:ubiquitin carboxyl-terminal hydrolase MINDY-1 [Lagopus leucura]XP_042749560.1 ubiquitin carboxyl-terminal hydrolase MINDY-1 [Lagopus leucura]XP_042749561.1 ubiquitin carboxyl-terminal hydrolase MINDY-1 [Lagopus leucura]
MELQSELGAMLSTTGDDAQCPKSPEPRQPPRDAGGSEQEGELPSASGHSPALRDKVPHPSTTEEPAEQQESGSRGAQEELPTPREGDASPQAAAEPPSARAPSREPEPDFYCVKWITWKGERTPIITQSENGPCPLLAIMNILFLQWKVKLPPQKEVVTSEELMAHLGDCILSIKPQEKSEGLQLNFQQNVNDTMMVLPKLSTGLDVNVRFTGVSDFEYTPECIVFDLLNVPLYHGWLVDPQSPEAVRAVGKLSYNQLVEKIITCKHSGDPNLVTEGLIAEQFLESTASQLTYHGLCELTAAVKEEELSVFFRNNHFSTMIKHKGHLYLLVTDQGFLQEERVVWESLHNVDGDSCFCDTQFHLSHALGKEAAAPEQSQLDQDYMMALSLQQQQGQGPSVLSDLELARQLQQEEYQQQQQQQQRPPPAPPQGRAQQGGRPTPERRQRHKQNSDCTLL